MNQIVSPRFLFRWSFDVPKMVGLPRQTGSLLDLPQNCRLPALGELDQLQNFADIRMGWNESGLGLSVRIEGRTRPLKPVSDSSFFTDFVRVWIDTRNTQNVHRATKFCHFFRIFPYGGGKSGRDPRAESVLLARAREDATTHDASLIQLRSDLQPNGYILETWFPSSVFTGFDPASHPRLGFNIIVNDTEFGEQYLAVNHEFPQEVDPSLWQTIELKR